MRRYGANKKTRIIAGTVLEVEIGPNTTALGRRMTFVVAKFDFSGGDTKVATITIRSVNIHNPEPLIPDNNGGAGDRCASDTITTTGYTKIKYPVYVQVYRCQHYNL